MKLTEERLHELAKGDMDIWYSESQSMAKELLALRSMPIPDEFLNAQQNASGMFEISEDCMCQLLNMLCSKPIDNAT